MKHFILFWLLFCSYSSYGENFSMGYSGLNFKVSDPGSYQLYSLGKASNGNVLTINNDKVNLHDLYNNKIVLLGFIYLSCNDIDGCPLTIFVTSQIKAEIAKIDSLSKNVRLLSLSFDPQRDMPETLKIHSKHLGVDEKIWHLITTKNQQKISPILEKYNQPIQKIYDKNGKNTGKINHILRVFLIDKNKNIRNIYTNSFLHKDIVLSDIKTLLLEEDAGMKFDKTSQSKKHTSHHGVH